MFFQCVRVLPGDSVEWRMVGDGAAVIVCQIGKSWCLSDIADAGKVHEEHTDDKEHKNTG